MTSTRVLVRLPAGSAARFAALRERLEIPQARLFRALVLDRPLVAASHRRLWIRLARSAANLTQLRRHAEALPSGTPGLEELDQELLETRQRLQHLRGRLVRGPS